MSKNAQKLTVKGKTYKIRYFTQKPEGVVAVLDAYEDPSLKGKFGDEWPMVPDPKGMFRGDDGSRIGPAPS